MLTDIISERRRVHAAAPKPLRLRTRSSHPAYAAMRRPLIPLPLPPRPAGSPRDAPTHHVTEPVDSRHARPTRLNLQRDDDDDDDDDDDAGGWFGFGEDDDGALLSKAENWFKPKNHYTVGEGATRLIMRSWARDATISDQTGL